MSTFQKTGQRTGWPPVARLALAFVALWIPLTAIALATEWRGSWATPDDADSLVADYVLNGSAISGPLAPQLIVLALAFGARRQDRLGTLATGALAVVGALIAFNGAASAFTDHEHAPQLAASIAGVGFLLFGTAIVAAAARQLLLPRYEAWRGRVA